MQWSPLGRRWAQLQAPAPLRAARVAASTQGPLRLPLTRTHHWAWSDRVRAAVSEPRQAGICLSLCAIFLKKVSGCQQPAISRASSDPAFLTAALQVSSLSCHKESGKSVSMMRGLVLAIVRCWVAHKGTAIHNYNLRCCALNPRPRRRDLARTCH